MKTIFNFIKQEIFPGFYAGYVNKRISRSYVTQAKYEVDVSCASDNTSQYITDIKLDLANQLERKKIIEDKAKSLLFIITVAITAITFSLNYLNSLTINNYQTVSICLVFLSIIYFVFGAIRALQTINIRLFNINQVKIECNTNKFVLIAKDDDSESLKGLIRDKQLNDLIILRLSNFTYASFNLIRNGIVLFVLFFISTISFSYVAKKEVTSNKYTMEKDLKVKINDTIDIILPYTFDIKYDVGDIKVDKQQK